MANRINARLARLGAAAPRRDLEKELFALGEANSPPMLQRARRLFAKVLEAPGGLRIQTIHSFAQALLATFPAEAGHRAGVQADRGPGRAGACPDYARRSARRCGSARQRAADRRRPVPQPAARRKGRGRLSDAMRAGGRGDGRDWARRRHRAASCASHGPARRRSRIISPMHCGDDRFDCDLLRAIAEANRAWGTSTGTGVADQVERWLALAPADRAAGFPNSLWSCSPKRRIAQGPGRPAKRGARLRGSCRAACDAVAELLHIQNGARSRRTWRRACVLGRPSPRPTPGPSAAPASPISTT